mmetsp:Transcript_84118/g.236420  ORF Transcript_84118/g.236420 Transcript_84118/m.236420 type:complete len:238 (+) Transcript_84118:104-817(+)
MPTESLAARRLTWRRAFSICRTCQDSSHCSRANSWARHRPLPGIRANGGGPLEDEANTAGALANSYPVVNVGRVEHDAAPRAGAQSQQWGVLAKSEQAPGPRTECHSRRVEVRAHRVLRQTALGGPLGNDLLPRRRIEPRCRAAKHHRDRNETQQRGLHKVNGQRIGARLLARKDVLVQALRRKEDSADAAPPSPSRGVRDAAARGSNIGHLVLPVRSPGREEIGAVSSGLELCDHL